MESKTTRRVASILSALTVAMVAVVIGCRPAPEPGDNIVVVVVDTLRADHLGTYGYQRDTSPALDAMAQRGTVFTTAYSVSNWTNPAIKTILTGRSPQAVMPEATHTDAITMPLPASLTTFAELAAERGYRTAALVDHPGMKPWGNFDKGFEHYTMLYEEGVRGGEGWGKSPIDYVAGQFGERLDAYGDEAFLIYVHVIYPHRPYEAPDAYAGMFGPDAYDGYDPAQRQAIVNAYDAEIRRTDDLVARIHDALEARGLLEGTWVLLTTDHGEGFWEHGFAEHGNAFYDEAIRIPMILVPPRGQQGVAERIDAPVSNLDVFATVLDIAGVDLPEETPGLSLTARGSARTRASRILFSESPHSYDIRGRAIIRDGIKYMSYPGRPAPERNLLFNLNDDPLELENLYGTETGLRADLRRLLEGHRERSAVALARLEQTFVEPDAETLERLRALGYIR